MFKIGWLWHQIWKDRPKLSQKKLFWSWWRRRWRHGETLKIVLYIHVYFTPWVFQLLCKISETNSVHYQMAINISYIKIFILRIYLQNWPGYRYSKFQFCLLRSAISTQLNTRVWAMFSENFSAIASVAAEIWHFEVGLLVSSALHSVAGEHTQLVCLRVFTRIVLMAKRSFSRTAWLSHNAFYTFGNLFQLVWQPKNTSFFRTWWGTAHFRSPSFPARVTL